MGIFRDAINSMLASAEKRKKKEAEVQIQAQQQAAANAAAEAAYRASPAYSSVLDKNFAAGAPSITPQEYAQRQQEKAYKASPEYTQILDQSYGNSASKTYKEVVEEYLAKEQAKKDYKNWKMSPEYAAALDKEQIKHKSYTYGLGGGEKPLDIADVIADEKMRWYNSNVELAKMVAEEVPIVADWTSVVANLANTMQTPEALFDYLDDGEIDTTARYNDAGVWRDVARQTRAENISKDTERIIRDAYQINPLYQAAKKKDTVAAIESLSKAAKTVASGMGDLYGTSMSLADSYVNRAFFAPFGGEAFSLAMMGAGSFNNAMRNAKEKGFNDDVAFVMGLVSGVAEYYAEKIKWPKRLDTATLNADSIKYVLVNMLTEAGEEGVTSAVNEIAEVIADVIGGTEHGELMQTAENYKSQGKTESEAYGLAVADRALSVLKEAALGGISGGIGAGSTAAINSIAKKAAGSSIVTDSLNQLKDNYVLTEPSEAQMIDYKKDMVDRYARKALGKAGVNTFNTMYADVAETVQATSYVSEMTKFYNAALNGQDINSVEVKDIDGITPQMREAAYLAGQSDAKTVETAEPRQAAAAEQTAIDETIATEEKAENEPFTAATEEKPKTAKTIEFEEESEYNNNIAESEVISNEEQSSDTEVGLRDSGKRNDGTYSGTESRSVAERAGQIESRRQAVSRTAKDGGTSALTFGNEISVAALGIAKGSTTDFVREVKGGDTEYTKIARQVAKENGIHLVMVDRDMIIGGRSVRGYISGDRMFINVNHPDFTADQIAKHEATHKKIVKGLIDVNAIKERIAKKHDVKAISRMYAEMYASSGMTDEQAFIEMICDAEGDMNIFEGRLDAKAKQYAGVLQDVKQEARESESRTKAKEFAEEYGEDEAFSANPPKKKKPKYWHTGFTAAEVRYLNEQVKIDAAYSTKQITDTANWYFVRGETPYLTVYSTEVIDNPTILYASKGEQAVREKNAIENILRWYDDDIDTNAERYDKYSQKEWSSTDRRNSVGGGTVQAGNAIRNDSLDVKESWSQFSSALRTVFKNLQKTSYKTRPRGAGPILAEAGGTEQQGGVEGNYSANPDTDSLGNKLSEQQQEYFAESKVRNADGNLKMMFRGGDEEFSVFDRKKSKYSNLYGRGFYFTDSESHAKQYGNIKKFYLNIVNPVLTTKNTISKQQFKKFLEAVAENEDDFSFENYGYGATVESVLKSVYNKDRSDFNLLYDVSQTAIGDMVAAVELFNSVNGTSFDGLILDTETVAFYPEQIKDTSNKKPTSNPDVFFSANPDNDIESLRAENWRLRQNIEWLKRGEANEVIEKDVKYEAGELLKAYGSTASKNDIAEQMQRLGNYIVQSGDKLQWDNVKERATQIASEVINNVEVLTNDEQMQEFAEIRKYLRKGFSKDGINKIKIADEYRSDVDPDFEAWRKRHMGQFVISKDGTPIDTLWADMQEQFGTRWFPDDITHPGDQLRHIGTLFDETTAIYENPWSYDMAVAVESCANDILDRLSRNVRTERYTEEEHVEHAKEWLAGQEYKAEAQRAAKAIERLKEKQKKEIDKVWDKYREKSENRALRGFRDSILKHVSRMSTKLLHATDKNHVPDALKEPALKIVSAINLDSDYVYEYNPYNNTYKLVKTDAAKGETKPTNRSIEFEKVRKQLIAMKDSLVIDPDLLSDGEVSGLIDEVIALGDKPLGKMNRAELEVVWKAIRGIEMAISSYNKTFSESRWASVEDAATALVDDNSSKKAPKVLKHGQKFRDLQKLDMLTPETYFHEMGDAGDSIFRMMRDAQDKEITLLSEAVDFTNDAIGKMNINKIAKKQHTVTLGGEEVKLTTGQIISIYLLSKREQAKEHIYVGGILPTDIDGKGNEMIHHTTPIRGITAQEVKAAVSVLSAEEVQLADKMQKFLSEDVAKWGNEASMKVYGYKKFGDKDYWPIKSNSQELKKSTEKETQVTSVANKGMTKAVVPNANNSVILESAFDTFANHVVEMANYSAWLATMEDVNRIRNYKFSATMDGDIGTVSQVIEKVHGNKGSAYLSKLLADIANGPAKMDSGNPFGRLVGKTKAAAVGGNLRVIIQQPTAILRALDMIDPQYFVAGINVGKAWEKAKKYAPIAKWKGWGYFDIHTGRQLQNVMFNTDTALEKTQNLFMWGASIADSISWGRIWAACEAETRHKHKELAKGSEEFYKAVAKRFTEVIDHTQVVDGILQRSQIMRNPDNLAKMATSFMGEPTKQYNMLLSAAYDATHKKGAQSKVKFARTAAALTLGAVVNAAAQSIIDAMRDDDKEERYWEKWLDNFFGFTGEEKKPMDYVKAALNGNLPSAFNPLGYVPYYKDITSLIQGYDVTRMDMDSIESVLTAAQNMTKALEGNGKYNIAGASANLFLEMSRLLGIPVANLKRDVKAAVMTYAVESDNYLLQYRMEKALLNVNYSSNSGTFMGILYNAYTKDKKAYKVIYADLVKDGYDIEKIKTAMENRMKADQGVTKLNELNRRWATPEEEEAYEKLKGKYGAGSAADDYAYVKASETFEDESSMYYDALYEAMTENFEDYTKIYDDVYDIIYAEELEKVKADEDIDKKDWEEVAAKRADDAIGGAIENRMKDEQGLKSVKDLEQRWINPHQQMDYEKELKKFSTTKDVEAVDDYVRAKIADKNTEQFDALASVYGSNKKAYLAIYNDMIKSGVEEEKIRDSIEARWKKEQGVKEVDDLKTRWLSPEEEKTYNKVSSEVKRSELWRKASAQYKEKTLDKLYDLAVKTDKPTSAGSEMQAKIDGGKKYGLTESEYMLFLMARDIVDKPSEKSGKLGSYTNDEVEAAIRMLKLSREENSYLWRAAGKNPNSDPWK